MSQTHCYAYFFTAAITLLSAATPREARALPPATKFNRIDTASEERFGASVSLSATTAIIGAPNDATSGIRPGAAYIFDRQPSGEWLQTNKFTSATPVHGEAFGYSVSISGHTSIVGSHGEFATILQRTGGVGSSWQPGKELTLGSGSPNQWFGWAVGVSGSTAIVGAPNAQTAYIFDRNNGGSNNWGQTIALQPVGGISPMRFGYTVGISGDTAIVGAMYEQSNGFESGAAYIYERNSGGLNHWGSTVRLQPSDLIAYDRFGQGIAIDGNTAVVGAWWDNGNGAKTGSAYVFERNAGGPDSWGQVAKLTAPDITDHFGFSVSISGDLIVIGAPADDDLGNQAGAAYFFERNRGGLNQWKEFAKVTANDGFSSAFGESVSISGPNVIVGVTYDSQFGRQSGAAYAFSIPEPKTLAFVSIAAIAATAHRRRLT